VAIAVKTNHIDLKQGDKWQNKSRCFAGKETTRNNGRGVFARIPYHPNEKPNLIAEYLENRFTSHDLCDEKVETTIQALLASVDDAPLGKVRPCDLHKLANSLKLIKACGHNGIPDECIRHFPRRSFV
jgi:hypothetical protein